MFEEAQSRRSRTPLYAVASRRPAPPERCLMEVASWLAGEAWTDHPECVHQTLGAVARGVYDHSSRAARTELMPLAPSLVGTARSGLELPARLVGTCVSTALSSPLPERIGADQARRLHAARRTALYLMSRAGGADGAVSGEGDEDGEDGGLRTTTRMWVRVLDPLRLTEPVYRRLVSPEAAAEAVAVTACASGEERDQRLSRLLRWCIGLARRTGDDGPGNGATGSRPSSGE
jgi:hypothetical protein